MLKYFMENPSMREHMQSVIEEERKCNNDSEVIDAINKMCCDLEKMTCTQEA